MTMHSLPESLSGWTRQCLFVGGIEVDGMMCSALSWGEMAIAMPKM
ncbi:hypothetical protein [Oscillatoria acuminata]|nr:hypothetical protein [Oscillatoria acuminata]